MSRSEAPLSCARVQVLLEPYVDDELAPARRARVDAHLQRCPDCASALQGARSLQRALQELPALEVPGVLADRLRAALPQEPVLPRPPSWQDRVARAVSRTWDALWGGEPAGVSWWRPVAAVVVIVAVVLVWAQQRQPAQAPPQVSERVSEQELRQAHDQVRWTLAYLANVTAGAGDTAFLEVGDVMGQVIGEHVMGSVTDAVGRSLEPGLDPVRPAEPEEEVQTP